MKMKMIAKIPGITLSILAVLFIGNPGVAQVNKITDVIPMNATDISPLLVGEEAPDAQLANLKGEDTPLKTILSEKPTVLIFYRGGWCPYCNAHLAELNEIEDQVIQLGYQIVAVSPDNAEHLSESVNKHSLKYKLYSDKELMTAKKFGIVYQVPERLTKRVEEWSGGENKDGLPVPSVFVFNTDGEILFEYINPNYKVRISGDLLLAVLKSLQN